MGYSEVKTKINNQIKTNGNQEITGAILNDVLNDMLDYSEEGGGVSVSQNTSTGHTDINIGSDSYPVASVEEVSQLGQEAAMDIISFAGAGNQNVVKSIKTIVGRKYKVLLHSTQWDISSLPNGAEYLVIGYTSETWQAVTTVTKPNVPEPEYVFVAQNNAYAFIVKADVGESVYFTIKDITEVDDKIAGVESEIADVKSELKAGLSNAVIDKISLSGNNDTLVTTYINTTIGKTYKISLNPGWDTVNVGSGHSIFLLGYSDGSWFSLVDIAKGGTVADNYILVAKYTRYTLGIRADVGQELLVSLKDITDEICSGYDVYNWDSGYYTMQNVGEIFAYTKNVSNTAKCISILCKEGDTFVLSGKTPTGVFLDKNDVVLSKNYAPNNINTLCVAPENAVKFVLDSWTNFELSKTINTFEYSKFNVANERCRNVEYDGTQNKFYLTDNAYTGYAIPVQKDSFIKLQNNSGASSNIALLTALPAHNSIPSYVSGTTMYSLQDGREIICKVPSDIYLFVQAKQNNVNCLPIISFSTDLESALTPIQEKQKQLYGEILNINGTVGGVNQYLWGNLKLIKDELYKLTLTPESNVTPYGSNDIAVYGNTITNTVIVRPNTTWLANEKKTITFRATTDADTYALISRASAAANINIVLEHIVDVTKPFNDASYKVDHTIIVAASDSSDEDKAFADFVCTGTHDELVIQQAIDSLNSAAGCILLRIGTYYIDGFYSSGNTTTYKTAILVKNFNDQRRDVTIMGPDNGTRCSSYYGDCVSLYIRDSAFADIDADEQLSVIAATGLSTSNTKDPHWGINVKNLKIDFESRTTHKCIGINLERCGFGVIDNVRLGAGGVVSTNIPDDETKPIEGLIGIRGYHGWSSGSRCLLKDIFVMGFYEAFQIGGEHLVIQQCTPRGNIYGWTFGNYTDRYDNWNYGAYVHPITLIQCGDEMNWYGPQFYNGYVQSQYGPILSQRQCISFIDFTIEEWLYPAEEHENCSYCGNINYSYGNGYNGNEVNCQFWKTGSGKLFHTVNSSHALGGPTTLRNTYTYPEYMQTFFDETLNKLLIYDGTNWRDSNGTVV